MKNVAIESLPERLKLAIGEGRKDLLAVVEKTGMQEAALRRYIKGEVSPGIDKVFEIAQATNVRAEWLFTGEEPMRASGIPDNGDNHGGHSELAGVHHGEQNHITLRPEAVTSAPPGYTLIPHIDVKAAAGDFVLLPGEEIVDFILFLTDYLRRDLRVNPDNVVVIQAKGDSMDPTIRDTDLLLVDLGQAFDADDAVYVLNYEGRIMVKRLQFRFDGALKIMSDNPKYEPQLVKKADGDRIRLVGRVVWSGGRL